MTERKPSRYWMALKEDGFEDRIYSDDLGCELIATEAYSVPKSGEPLLSRAEWEATGQRIWRCVWRQTLNEQQRCKAGLCQNHKTCGWVIVFDAAVGEETP